MPISELTRPIVGIENRTPQEVFDIMADRIRLSRSASPSDAERHERAVSDDFTSGYDAGLRQGEADVSITTRQAILKAHAVLKIYQGGMLAPSIDVDNAVTAIELAGLNVSPPPAAAQETVAVCMTCNGTGKEGRHSICRDCDELADALEPFADQSEFWSDQVSDKTPLLEKDNLKVGDVRRAAKALDKYRRAIRSALSPSQSDPAAEIAALRAEIERLRRRYQVLCDWYLRGGMRAEIFEHGHIIQTTQQHIDDWADRAAVSPRQEEAK